MMPPFATKLPSLATGYGPKLTNLYTPSALRGVPRVSNIVNSVSSTHTTNQCILAADPDPELPARLKAVESAVVSLATQHRNAHKVYRPLSTKICRLYNDNRCRFPKCRYHHACLKCNGEHPVSSCPQGSKTPGPMSAPLSTAVNRREAARPY